MLNFLWWKNLQETSSLQIKSFDLEWTSWCRMKRTGLISSASSRTSFTERHFALQSLCLSQCEPSFLSLKLTFFHSSSSRQCLISFLSSHLLQSPLFLDHWRTISQTHQAASSWRELTSSLCCWSSLLPRLHHRPLTYPPRLLLQSQSSFLAVGRSTLPCCRGMPQRRLLPFCLHLHCSPSPARWVFRSKSPPLTISHCLTCAQVCQWCTCQSRLWMHLSDLVGFSEFRFTWKLLSSTRPSFCLDSGW